MLSYQGKPGMMDAEMATKLDPSDPRKRYEQVAASLRASILTGELEPGDRLPTVAALADEFGVSKTTVEKAIDVLKVERLVVARQGAGTFVRQVTTRPTGLRPYLEAAFESAVVKIDFYGFSGETLHGAMTECLDKVRTGRYQPRSVDLRLMVPDTSAPWALPANSDGSDSPEFRQRHQKTIDRYALGLIESVEELVELGLVESGSVEIRTVGTPPMSKLYVVNEADVFFGWYPVTKHKVKHDGRTLSVLDLMGKDTELFHFQPGQTDDPHSAFLSEALAFFESQWTLVAKPLS